MTKSPIPASMVLLISLCACTSLSTIEEHYSDELGQLDIGMSLDQFKEILPRATIAGQTSVDGKKIDAYELRHIYQIPGDYFRREDFLWFYFYGKQLVKWGSPGDWPEPADLVIEIR